MPENNRPTWNCYWLKPGKVMVGEYPISRALASVKEKLKGFVDAGFTFFLDLTEPGEMPPYDEALKELGREIGRNIEYTRIPIKDVGVPTRETMINILDTIDRAVSENRIVYVHCRGGIGRTATIAGCYLVRHGMNGEHAIEAIQKMLEEVEPGDRMPRTPGTYEQQYLIKHWDEHGTINEDERLVEEDVGLRLHRYTGCLIGMAVGEAYGVGTQSLVFGRFKPVDRLTGGGIYGLKPGEWEDATAMSLCIAESLIEKKGIEPVDQMRKLIAWRDGGHLSATGKCLGITVSVAQALRFFEQTNNPITGINNPYLADNICLARVAPIAMMYRKTPEKAIQYAEQTAMLTHGSKTAIDACKYFVGLVIGALNGRTKNKLVSDRFHPVYETWKIGELQPAIEKVASGSFKRRYPPTIKTTNYVVDSLEAALWAFHRSNSYREGCLMIANLGDDSTTVGAIFGQLAGAFYGYMNIPQNALERVALRDEIERMAKELFRLSEA